MATLKATRRTEVGTRQVRRLRDADVVPGILYGHGQEVVPLSLAKHEVDLAIHHGERLWEIDCDGRNETALVKEVQYDTFGQEVLHVDLTRVNLDEQVEVTVPIVLRGTPAGADEGGVLDQVMAEVRVECLVRSIPEEIRILVNEMNVGDRLQAGDLELPEGAKLLDEPEALVCTVRIVVEEVEEPTEEAEATAEPEVVGGKPEEEPSEDTGGKR